MYKKITQNGFNLHNHLRIAKVLFVFFNLLIFTVYGSLLLLFNEFPLDIAQESFFALNLFGIASGLAFSFTVLNIAGDALYCYIAQSKPEEYANQPMMLQYNTPANQTGAEAAFAS